MPVEKAERAGDDARVVDDGAAEQQQRGAVARAPANGGNGGRCGSHGSPKSWTVAGRFGARFIAIPFPRGGGTRAGANMVNVRVNGSGAEAAAQAARRTSSASAR